MVLILRITLNKAVGYCVQLTIMFCHLEILLTNSSTCEMKTGCHVAKYTCKTISAAASWYGSPTKSTGNNLLPVTPHTSATKLRRNSSAIFLSYRANRQTDKNITYFAGEGVIIILLWTGVTCKGRSASLPGTLHSQCLGKYVSLVLHSAHRQIMCSQPRSQDLVSRGANICSGGALRSRPLPSLRSRSPSPSFPYYPLPSLSLHFPPFPFSSLPSP